MSNSNDKYNSYCLLFYFLVNQVFLRNIGIFSLGKTWEKEMMGEQLYEGINMLHLKFWRISLCLGRSKKNKKMKENRGGSLICYLRYIGFSYLASTWRTSSSGESLFWSTRVTWNHIAGLEKLSTSFILQKSFWFSVLKKNLLFWKICSKSGGCFTSIEVNVKTHYTCCKIFKIREFKIEKKLSSNILHSVSLMSKEYLSWILDF